MALTKVTGGLLGNLPTGTSNVAVGDTALDSITSDARHNVAIGGSAGTAITTGDFNSFIGSLAGFTETGGGIDDTKSGIIETLGDCIDMGLGCCGLLIFVGGDTDVDSLSID